MTARELAQVVDEIHQWVTWLENATQTYAGTDAAIVAESGLRTMLDEIIAAGGRVTAFHAAALPTPPVDIEGTLAVLDELVFEAPPPRRNGPVDPMRRVPSRPELVEDVHCRGTTASQT
ncbi:hypothetical protein [Methylorubrum aminovorans]